MIRNTCRMVFAALLFAAAAATASAQQTTGTIAGRVLDEQKAAVPGATVTARNTATGFTRVEVSDAEGVYRITGLPVGSYTLGLEMSGFQPQTRSVQVSVSETLTADFDLHIAKMAENVTVTAESPLVDTTSSAVGGVVDPRRVESLPLNGRQFANLAVTVPGVGLGFHSDPTKSTQYSPQINGGNGRNVNYQIDGGDNNDDTVGGLLQLFPLEAIQEFNFLTSRYKAEYGRSNGGVMNIVTKSGTNQYQGSAFELFRDKSMNAQTETERRSGIDKQDYRRNQFGGSVGGPIARDRAHFFFAAERTQQNTTQAVTTNGLFPSQDGVYQTPYRETLLTGKATANLTPTQYLTVRYGRNQNSQPYGATPLATPDDWGDSENHFNSINLNHNASLKGSRLNEFVFQYADFDNHISARSNAPNQSFPNGVTIGQNLNTPQSTAQKKYQFRDDFSWHVAGKGGLGHDFKVGANFINEPHLFITFNTAKGVVQYTHLTNDVNGPLSTVQMNDGDSSANIPLKQYAVYAQDDWRASDRLTVNLGVRYDLVRGLQFDQSKNPNYVLAQQLGAAGRFANVVGYENFGLSPKDDTNNVQPRLGAVWDVRGDSRDLIRAGWGIYTDFGYTNSNVLFAAADASGSGFGAVFSATDPNGIKNPDGSFWTVGQSLNNIAGQNQVTAGSFPLFGQWVDPRLQMPYQMQANAGWSHQLTADTVISADYVNSLGRDLNYRLRLNQIIPGAGVRQITSALSSPLSPNAPSNRPAVSLGKSTYNALILGARRRLSKGLDFSIGYTLSSGTSNIGNASDELNTSNVQNPFDPVNDPRQVGPNVTTDARHRVNISGVIQVKGGFQIAPFYIFRSALPVNLVDGRDLNGDGDAFDIPSEAFAVDSFDVATGKTTMKDIGACTHINCGRGMSQQQFNLRVSKSFPLMGRARVEAIGEIFNLFNNVNPSGFRARVTVPTTGLPDANLLQPTTFSGDAQRPEQRVGQIGFRFSF
jgi:outer membrane receptor protein involved in Fe transport